MKQSGLIPDDLDATTAFDAALLPDATQTASPVAGP
jgi:hypothetical protein